MKSITKHKQTLPRAKVLAPNHTIITTSYGKYLTSYDSVVVFLPNDTSTVFLGKDWDYSSTTSKHRNKFLDTTTNELRSMLKDGRAQLVDL